LPNFDEPDHALNHPLMISVSGVRGIVSAALTPEIALKFAHAYGTFLRQSRATSQPVVVLGRDTRVSGPMFKHAVLSGLIATGCRVIDLDIVATPTLQLAVPYHQADGAVCLTASHNPIEWNALKFFRPNGMYLDAELGRELLNLYATEQFACNRWDALGTVEVDAEAAQRHLAKILESVDVALIRARRFKVALDCCCGAGATISVPLLHALGCELIEVDCELTGLFPRNPEPVAENLGKLCEVVKQTGADLGFAQDADVDRLSIVDDTGVALGEEFTLMLATEFVLSHRKGHVVTNLSTTMALDDIARAHGCTVTRTPIGDVNVAEKIRELGAVIGGEGNGGIINPAIQLGRDAPAACALVLQLLAERQQSLSTLAAALPQYVIVKKSLHATREQAAPVIAQLKATVTDAAVDQRDGLKLLWSDRWVHLRSSGTEPIVRVIAEAKTRDGAEALCEAYLAKLRT